LLQKIKYAVMARFGGSGELSSVNRNAFYRAFAAFSSVSRPRSPPPASDSPRGLKSRWRARPKSKSPVRVVVVVAPSSPPSRARPSACVASASRPRRRQSSRRHRVARVRSRRARAFALASIVRSRVALDRASERGRRARANDRRAIDRARTSSSVRGVARASRAVECVASAQLGFVTRVAVGSMRKQCDDDDGARRDRAPTRRATAHARARAPDARRTRERTLDPSRRRAATRAAPRRRRDDDDDDRDASRDDADDARARDAARDATARANDETRVVVVGDEDGGDGGDDDEARGGRWR
jgi:hypothetical protein